MLSKEMQKVFGKQSGWRVVDGPERAAEMEAFRAMKKKERAAAKKMLQLERPMLMRIYTRRGRRWAEPRSPHAKASRAHLYVHGPGLMGFTGVGRGLRKDLLAIEGVRSWQAGDDEFSVVFGPETLPKVADLVKPFVKRKRKSATP